MPSNLMGAPADNGLCIRETQGNMALIFTLPLTTVFTKVLLTLWAFLLPLLSSLIAFTDGEGPLSQSVHVSPFHICVPSSCLP